MQKAINGGGCVTVDRINRVSYYSDGSCEEDLNTIDQYDVE